MSTAAPDKLDCRGEEIVAYLDGELEGRSLALFEDHLAECSRCAAELELERRLLNELDSALAKDASVEMPKNFAQVVAARAQSNMSGVRDNRERRRALGLCVLLGSVAVALLGGPAVRDSILAPLRAIWTGATALLGFLGHALYDAGAGLAIISRTLSGHLIFESRPFGLVVLLLFVAALFMLRRLIVRYHTRARAVEQS